MHWLGSVNKRVRLVNLKICSFINFQDFQVVRSSFATEKINGGTLSLYNSKLKNNLRVKDCKLVMIYRIILDCRDKIQL